MPHSSALTISLLFLRILIMLNWLFGAAILALLVATVVATEWTTAALGISPASELRSVLPGLQVIAGLGVAAVPLYHAILIRLLAIVKTVRSGDPFVTANAERLQAIAWVLVALQLLSLAIAAVGKMVATPTFPIHLDAGLSVSGWLAVLLAFVLARVFAEGARMRDELEGTV
jgi:hypothetical protein